jgi:hypothetical protein
LEFYNTQKNYMISITSEQQPSQSFTSQIFPSGHTGAQVRGAHFDDEETLALLLNRCLPKDIIVEKVIKTAKETGVCDLREREIPLSDEYAAALGWIF